MTVKEVATTIALGLLAAVIGAGVCIIVTRAIDQAKQTACFDYHTEEACEETKDGK